MADTPSTDGPDQTPDQTDPPRSEVAATTYDLLRGRLGEAAEELSRRANDLNRRRTEVFGSAEFGLIATERVRTDNNVVPRDVAAVGRQLILAYNATAGVRAEIRPEDVFAVHHFEPADTRDAPPDISPNPDGLAGSALDDKRFRRDFGELMAYFKDARIQQVYAVGQKLLAVFRTGTSASDIRVLRWQIEPGGTLSYLDDRGERDHRYPPRHDVDWVSTTRADHVDDRYVLIADRILVDPLEGTLELRYDDGGPEPTVLLSESVMQADQALQDCEVSYGEAGDLVIVRVRPYGEQTLRHYVVNRLLHTAVRLDPLQSSFRQLPDGHGLIFPDGLYLRTGQLRSFDVDPGGMELLEVVHSPNGEDVLYVFHQPDEGRSILLPYNIVTQDVATPIWCHGHCLFENGGMVIFREEPNPTRIHPIQIWSTPFCSDEWYESQPRPSSGLTRVGNAGLVAGVADVLSLVRLVGDLEPSAAVYGDLVASAGRTLDAHHWMSGTEVGNLAEPVSEIRRIAEQVIDEFERVEEVRLAGVATMDEAEAEFDAVLREVNLSPPTSTQDFVARLGELRHSIGRFHGFTQRRDMDIERAAALEAKAQEAHDTLAQAAAARLAEPDSFVAYHRRLGVLDGEIGQVEGSVEAADILDRVDAVGDDMDVVAATVGDLVVDDTRVRTAVLEQVSGVLAELNRVRAAADNRRNELVEAETGEAFATELSLFSQTIATTLARADSPEACDDALARLLLQLEQLETAGPRTPGQLDELNERREHAAEIFTARRQQLLNERQRHGDRLVNAATRNLERLESRASSVESIDDVHGLFAADPMAVRLRSIVEQLRSIGESIKADELSAAIANAADNAVRTQRDRLELYEGEAIRLGRHRFSVERRRRDLSLVPSDDHLEAVLTGTDLRLVLDRPELDRFRDLWATPLPSESPSLYRSAFLAGDLVLGRLASTARDGGGAEETDPLTAVREAIETRLDEGYDRGVHDADAARLMEVIARAALAAGTLIHPGSDRAEVQLAWHLADDDLRDRWRRRGEAAAGLGIDSETRSRLVGELADELSLTEPRARYLLAELSTGHPPAFAQPSEATALIEQLAGKPEVNTTTGSMDRDIRAAHAIMCAFVARTAPAHLVGEVAAALVIPDLPRRTVDVDLTFSVSGLQGRHPTIVDGTLTGRVDELLAAVDAHRTTVMPRQREFQAIRRETVTDLRRQLRLGDLEPAVPEGFVRNQLIDRVYLPLIGDNLARQIGSVDDGGGARSGLLMLLSPPGYGKTMLVEYVAERLGMALVKVSGPGLGHDVTSLDPAQAPSATAAREIERINLAFAIGSGVMLYIDDIQHTNTEFLQRFISLCDAQRRVEGVWDGQARTFDLRGKRFAVVMAGNPYTESGQRFVVPDMLANRADTYDLGDVLAGNENVFALSYLENALSANPVTAPLVGRDPGDIDWFVQAARGMRASDDDLKHNYSAAEIDQIVPMVRHIEQVREVVLAVNRQYIASAATDDAYRSEPPFLLQGSYRNMARIVSKLVPPMTAAEVDRLIDEHYIAESRALTGAAEANLLRLARLRGGETPEQAARWAEIIETFRRRQRYGGTGDDPAAKVVAAIEGVAAALKHS